MQLAAEGRADDLRIFVEDGEAFLRRSDGAPYDAIINDVFVGREAVPFFASDEGIACARAHLTPGGLLMANCVVEYTGDAMYRLFSQVERLRGHFANVYVTDASDDEFGGADQLPPHSHRRFLPLHGRHPLRGLGGIARWRCELSQILR